MKSFGKAVVKLRYVILVLALALLIPSVIGMMNTRVNYDLLTYLPDTIETMQGQEILEEEFGTGAISMLVVEDMSSKDISALKEQIEQVDHVADVIWYDSFADISIPMEMLPDDLYSAFVNGDATLMAITYDSTTSSDETMDAVTEIRSLLDDHSYLQGMSAAVTDTRDLTEKEEPIYVGLAVLLAAVVLALTMDTFLAPVFFLLSIGMAIVYNLGTNMFLGQIAYITKAVAAVLQLGVTMDYSIFLWHSFKEYQGKYPDDNNRAMAHAIAATLQSVLGSSVTTIAGFAALCFMSFSLGLDLGIVMMKGVAFGVLSCVTILPSMILIFEPLIEKSYHKPLIPKLSFLPGFIQKHYRAVLIVFALIWIPAIWGYTHTDVYYDLMSTLPDSLPSMQASAELEENFDMNTTMMILVDKDVSSKEVSQMCDEMEEVTGVKSVIGVDAFVGTALPREILPEEITDKLSSDDWQLLLVTSEYKVASDEVNTQIETLQGILKSYDPSGMLIGDAPCTKDLITISDRDFNIVNWVSIAMIFVIIFVVFKSLSLPFLLVLTIEFAIFINMAVPYYTSVSLPFVASIIIGTVQLGSTVDYAILMTSRYQKERSRGKSKEEAIRIAHSTSIPSIIVSGLTFFASTFGVGLYSSVAIVSSICTLMARGALISTVTVIVVLPAILMLFDPVIIRSSIGFGYTHKKHTGRRAHTVSDGGAAK